MLPVLLLLFADINGTVTAVKDGDTIVVTSDSRQVTVRLASIDAPERRQPFGTAAKQHLSAMVFGKTCQIVGDKRDRYGRVIGQVYVDGVDVNASLVADGLAWQYRRYDKSEYLERYQSQARRLKRGLWAGERPVEPWRWRREQHAPGR